MSDDDDDLMADVMAEILPTAAKEEQKAPDLDSDEAADLDDFMAGMNLQQEDTIDPELLKPWMKYHKMELVQDIGRVKEVINGAIEFGTCSLDLESTGLDTRIDFDSGGKPHTKSKVVGYCVGYDGNGYYIPVRHNFDPIMGEENPNVSPALVDPEITRLCYAAQPVLTEEGKANDPLASNDIAEPGKVKLLFWHAKFDQEMLYPVTGIDFWHPESYEDGMLMFYCVYSDDMSYELKQKAKQFLRIKDPETGEEYPYEMIKYDKLFPKGTPKENRRIHTRYPRPDNEVTRYGCSDAICTELLCKLPWLVERLEKTNRGIYRLEKMTTQAVRIMERSRVLIDKAAIEAVRQEAITALKEVEKQIKGIAEGVGFHDFNPGSTEQLASLLFDKKWLNLEPKPDKTTEGQYKTDAKTLEKLMERPGAPAILKLSLTYRQIQKVQGTYLDKMVENVDEFDQLRFDFKQHGAATGRFSAPQEQKEERAFGREGYSGIPIQGIPARDNPKKPKVAGSLRKGFIARPGYVIVKVDYAGQELRIVTNLSGEPVWEKEFLEGTGDLHTITAKAFFPGLQRTDPDFKVKRTSGKCVHPDTLVCGVKGYRPLRSLTLFPKESDRFLGASPPDVEIDGNPVVDTYNGGVKKLYHVVTSKGIVTCTANHRFRLANGSLVRAGDLQKGQELAPVELPSLRGRVGASRRLGLWKGVPRGEYRLGLPECYFAGLYLGDGTVSNSGARLTHGRIGKTCPLGVPYKEWQQILLKACTDVGLDPTPEATSLYLGSRVVVRYLEALELVVPRPGTAQGRMKNLRVPSWVLEQGQKGFMAFLAGLLDTDGSVSHQMHTIEVTTKDFIFAGQLAALAQACGLPLSVEPTFNKTYRKHYARLHLTVGSAWSFRKHLRHPGKVLRLKAPQKQSSITNENIVKKVFPAGKSACLDVTMGTVDHLYRANGMLTHNSANFSLIYGGGVQAVMRATGCDKTEAARKLGNFHDSVPKFAKWVKKQHAGVKRHLGVRTAFGRFIAIPNAAVKVGDVKKDYWGRPILKEGQEQRLTDKDVRIMRSSSERVSTNYPIQGCLDSRSLVNTQDGWVSIGSLVEAGQPFVVWTGSRWAEATAHDMGPCELAEVKLKDGTIVRCDTRHKLLVVSDAGYRWVEYQDLEPGMAVATALCEPVEYEPSPLPSMSQRERSRARPQINELEAFWYWMGRYVGDGRIDHRGGIQFFFGEHEREAVDRCLQFWEVFGLNSTWGLKIHTPHKKESSRYTVNVWSVDLLDWLKELGFEPATAHTKRCPRRIFGETLAHRRAFLRGVMASDGRKPPLVTAKGNPYNVHLCQRPLLEDLKLLFRSAGVESALRGPYRSGEDQNGDDTISYRLDLNRRMYERHVVGCTDVRHPKFCDMFAPQFLVGELLKAGSWTRADFPDESSYNLYLRLRVGGRVTVYTLQRLCQLLGVKLPLPVYGFKRIVTKQALGCVEHTYTLSVQDKLHRFEADGVITKNSGADICKIALVKCVKAFHKRGWLRNGGDDSVRMLMTVHDEIVFEIRESRLMDAVPVISEAMESPDKMTRPAWKVPLVVEPLVGHSWDANVDWLSMIKGVDEDGKPYEVPEWLLPMIDLERIRKDEAARLERKGQPAPVVAKPQPTSTPAGVPPAAAATTVTTASAPAKVKTNSFPKETKEAYKTGSIATFAVTREHLTPDSVWMIGNAQLNCHPVRVAAERGCSNRCNLRLITIEGDLLIDPAFNSDGRWDIDPEAFSRKMREHNFPYDFRIDDK